MRDPFAPSDAELRARADRDRFGGEPVTPAAPQPKERRCRWCHAAVPNWRRSQYCSEGCNYEALGETPESLDDFKEF